MKDRKKETRKITRNGKSVIVERYKGDSNWVLKGQS